MTLKNRFNSSEIISSPWTVNFIFPCGSVRIVLGTRFPAYIRPGAVLGTTNFSNNKYIKIIELGTKWKAEQDVLIKAKVREFGVAWNEVESGSTGMDVKTTQQPNRTARKLKKTARKLKKYETSCGCHCHDYCMAQRSNLVR